MRPGEDVARRLVATHRIERDRQHADGPAQPTSTATRSLYQPQLGHTVCGSLAAAHRGQTLRAGACRRMLADLRLCVFDFDFFFLGTAMMTPDNGEGRFP